MERTMRGIIDTKDAEITQLRHRLKVYEDENYIGVSIKNKNGTSFLFVFATANNSVSEKHTLEIKGTTYSWVGTYFSKVIK